VLDAAAGAPIVVATHTRRAAAARSASSRREIGDASSRAPRLVLPAGARVASIKLLHYMEAGRAIVLRAGLAGALVHGESAWLLADDAGPAAFAAALEALAKDPALRERLGAGAQRVLAAHHTWPARAAETLALVRAALAHAGSR
jgi:glycosyltransferase involved in cell wall biosynthesis